MLAYEQYNLLVFLAPRRQIRSSSNHDYNNSMDLLKTAICFHLACVLLGLMTQEMPISHHLSDELKKLFLNEFTTYLRFKENH